MPNLGLGLGLNKKRQQAFQAAASAGTAEDYLGQHQHLANRISNIQQNRPNSQQASRLTSFISGPTAGQTPWKGGGAAPPPAAPTVTPPPAPPTTTPPGGPPPTLADIAKKYQIDIPDELKVAGAGAIKTWNDAQDWQNSAYEEQFNRLQQQSAREGDLNAAKIAESYGSMGARYGSDITTAEADMRRKQTLDLQTAGYDVRQGLNQQRLQQMAGAMGAMQTVGASKANIASTAMDKAWQDYALQQAPPAMWDEMMGYATSFNPPGQVVY
jgi:hypothetical protein